MEYSTPVSGSLDKSRVLDVRPLRFLLPVFPSAANSSSFPNTQDAAPFGFAPPSGPFPPGVAPFYPFGSPGNPAAVPNQNAHFTFINPISTAVPITTIRTPSTQHAAEANGDTSKPKRPKSSIRSLKKTKAGRHIDIALADADIESVVENVLASSNLTTFDTVQQANGDKELVAYILMMYDFLRRKVTQIEESKEAIPGVTRRPDLRVGNILMNKKIRTNMRRRIGAVAGVEVGDIFFFRMELCLIGLHAPCMAGIDYMNLKISQDDDPIAVSIVSSGGYEDNMEDGDVLIYSGQGGNYYRKGKEISDQKLERGNLALEKSLHRGNELRVIRGFKDVAYTTGKVYVYDGLYKIQESWLEKGKSGCNIFKYKLVRLPGQPEAFMIWKSIKQWKEAINSRVGLILPDLSLGAENLPVSLVNDVDDEKGPAHFTYFPTLKNSKPGNPMEPSTGCICMSGCRPGDPNCPCIKKNGGYLPYNPNAVLVNQKSLIYECGPSCQCPPNCRNRVSQGGLRVRLEVFKTKDKGWGLRSWDPIRAGAFICEYAGEVLADYDVEKLGSENNDDYIFDATRIYQILELPGDSNETPKIPHPLIISAKGIGNVARFMNHSCSPNVFWQPILRENKNELDLHIAFHAVRHIPPMTELTYDYGIVPHDKADLRKKKCHCGSIKCRSYFH